MNLFQPITIRGIEFKNRIVMPPMQVGIGMRGSRARAYYLERAKGGAGTVMMAAVSVDLFITDDAWGRPGGVDAFLDGVRLVINDIRQAGAKVGVQLWYGNRYPAGTGSPQDTRGELVAPSATNECRELTVTEIETIISRFAQASANARKAGFDFIEVHGAHGYLACQFFSPLTNQRRDEYGGDLSGRMRFGTGCVSAIRAAVGDDYPVFYRLGTWEDRAGGVTVDDASQFAVELEKAGVDVIDVSLGIMAGPDSSITPGPEHPEGTFVPLAEAVKRGIKVPVIAVGRFKKPEAAEAVLASGKADMIAVGRQLIADPYWPEKVAAGRIDDITPCIGCNACLETGLSESNLRCSVNALAGNEKEITIEPAARPKKVMVVGGGPAGMEAARVAAQRGHDVTLYEKQSQLGGQLITAAVPPYKHELSLLRDYLARQLEKSAVRVKPGIEITPEVVENEKPDAIIIATGSIASIPEITGIGTGKVVNALDVLSGAASVGQKVVIIGGELVGCETADFLSEQGKAVTVVRRGPEMASKVFARNRDALLARLENKGVNLITGVKRYEAITGEGLVIINSEGKQQILSSDTIVIAAGAVSDDRLAKSIEGKVSEIHLAGDCIQARRILDAIHEGARLGGEI